VPPTNDRPRIILLSPQSRRDEVFTAETYARLHALGDVQIPEGKTGELAAMLPALLPDADALLTGWGAPALSPELLALAPRLRIISHYAGSIKGLIPPEAFARGITVCHAADVIAEAVSEFTVLMILTGLRRPHLADRVLRAGGPWADARYGWFGHQLAGRTVGLVSCGYVARRVIALLKPFGVRILVHDPYLAPERAEALGVELVSLERVFAESTVVSNHAPITPETRHLIGDRHFALLPAGALFVNTARAWTVDPEALLAHLRTGRIWAAIDVFDVEPLPADSPFRALDNVLLTPHIAGQTRETYTKQATVAIEELERFFTGATLRYRVDPDRLAMMA
jgi:phosphoglycerate dehydrogenase-like enzyme